MALTLADTAIRAVLEPDVLTAWSVVEIRRDPPQTEGSPAKLPRAFVHLLDVEIQRGGFAALRDVMAFHKYRIVGEFLWPDSGTIEAAKVTKAQALLDILAADTVSHKYAGWTYLVEAIRFNDDAESTNAEKVYTITIDFTLEVICNA